MCDYSLEHYASRKAQVGDKLVIPDFTHGFMRPEDMEKVTRSYTFGCQNVCMTCLKKGTVLRLKRAGAGTPSSSGAKRAVEAVVGRYKGYRYREESKDYVKFGSFEMLIAHLGHGTSATVLSIPGVKPKAKKQSLETRLGLDKLNAKLPTAKEPAKVRAAYTRVRRPVRA